MPTRKTSTGAPATALDFLNNGVTTAFDFSDSRLPLEMDAHGQRIPAGQLKPFEHAAQQIRAKADAGLRFIHSTLLNDEIGDVEETLARFGETKAFGDSLDSDLYLGTAISGAVQSNGGSTRRPAPSAPS
jgi:5-methylthioadenosine/S-adenosylhomocysteine deaminase